MKKKYLWNQPFAFKASFSSFFFFKYKKSMNLPVLHDSTFASNEYNAPDDLHTVVLAYWSTDTYTPEVIYCLMFLCISTVCILFNAWCNSYY